jgi:DNA-binding response OmpR family regulator
MAAILVIDDEPDYCAVVGRYLQTTGHEVAVASNVTDIQESLKGAPPDLVLMDVRMPDVSGLELLPQLKARMSGTPVLVITALDDYRIADLLYEAGADGFLTKPVRFEELTEHVDRLLAAEPDPATPSA